MSTPSITLTPREVEILRAVAVGATNREIAGDLGIAPRTVGFHLENAFTKLGVKNRVKAVITAHACGLLAGRRA